MFLCTLGSKTYAIWFCPTSLRTNYKMSEQIMVLLAYFKPKPVVIYENYSRVWGLSFMYLAFAR